MLLSIEVVGSIVHNVLQLYLSSVMIINSFLINTENEIETFFYRVNFTNVVSLGWNTYLAWLAHR